MKRCPTCGQPVLNGFQVPIGLNVEAFAEMSAYRESTAQLRKGWGDIAKAKMSKHLAAYPKHVQQAAVDRSIENGWKGVFPEKEIQVAPNSGAPRQTGKEEWREEQAKQAGRREGRKTTREEGLQHIAGLMGILRG